MSGSEPEINEGYFYCEHRACGTLVEHFFAVLGIKPRALCMLDKHYTTELHPQPLSLLIWFDVPTICCFQTSSPNLACVRAFPVAFYKACSNF